MGNTTVELRVAVPDTPTYIATLEARGRPCKITEAGNTVNPPRLRIFTGNTVFELGLAVPDNATYMDIGSPRRHAEAQGSPRMLKVANP